MTTPGPISGKDAEIEMLRSERNRLKVALSFYANHSNWLERPAQKLVGIRGTRVSQDGGRVARDALSLIQMNNGGH